MVIIFFGIVMLMAGLITSLFPPKKINRWYGYRTRRSMHNETAWKTGNAMASRLGIIFGNFSIVAGSIIYLLQLPDVLHFFFAVLIILTVPVILYLLVEKKIKSTNLKS